MISNLRLIARLDVKAPFLIKGVHLEGLRKVGDPQDFARRYYTDGIDEIVYIDAVASLYERNTIVDIVRHTAESVFIPITVGGGVRSVEDARDLLRSGADKITINTAAIKNPDLIKEIAEEFGSQCMVLSIQAKRQDTHWEAYTDQGREHSGIDAIEWAQRGADLGAGEIFLTSIDTEGTGQGFDVGLTTAVCSAVNIPVIASGGFGQPSHISDLVASASVSAVAMAKALHYNLIDIPRIRKHAFDAGLPVRELSS